MRAASGSLVTLLNAATEIAVCDLLTIVLPSGTVVRLTSADKDMTATSRYDSTSHTFSSAGPPFTRGTTKLVRGLQVDTLSLTVHARLGVDTLSGLPWPQAADLGKLDNAIVVLEKLLMPNFADTSAGTLILFWGRVGQVESTRSSVHLEVRSILDLLQAPFPRNVYQPSCVHTLYDAGCTLSKASFAVTGAISGSASTTTSLNTNLAAATNYYDLGTLVFTSGGMAGQTRTVQHYTSGSPAVLTVLSPLPIAPTAGTTFTVYPGCDKLQATCSGKFSNLAHFRGYPYIPKAEVAR